MSQETTVETGEVQEYKILHPKTKQMVSLPMKIGELDVKGLFEAVIEKSRTENRQSLRNEADTYKAKALELEAILSQREQQEAETMTAAQKMQRDIEQYSKKAEQFKGEFEKTRNQLHSERIENAIMREASKNPDIYNIGQAQSLFMSQHKPKIVESDGKWAVVVEYEGNEVELSDAFPKWIAQDSNANLLKNKLAPGGGSQGGKTAPGALQKSRAEFFSLSPTAQHEFVQKGGSVV